MKNQYAPASVPAGRINKLFGTEGGVMLSLYEAFPDDFDPAETPLFVAIDGLDVPLWCERFERRGAAGAVASCCTSLKFYIKPQPRELQSFIISMLHT